MVYFSPVEFGVCCHTFCLTLLYMLTPGFHFCCANGCLFLGTIYVDLKTMPPLLPSLQIATDLLVSV